MIIHIGEIIAYEKLSIINLDLLIGEFNIMRTLKLVLPIALAVFLIFTTFQPEASTYYVDKSNPNASDNNPGTENEPWATIQKGIDVAQAGDTVFIKAGTYFISSSGLKMKRSGTTNDKIVFKNYGTDSVVIDMSSAPSKGWNWTSTLYNNIVIDGLNFLYGEWPIVIQGDYNEIKNCYLGFSSSTTINVWGGSHNLISNNTVEASGWNGIGIESRPDDGNKGRADSNIVEYNHCFNSTDHMGINIFPNTGQAQDLMYYNIIRFNTLNGNSSSGIYLRRQVNCEIYDNLIYNNNEWGIFFHWRNSSDGAHISNVKIYNNTIVDNGYDGIDNHSHKNLIIKNNIFAYNGDYEIDMRSAVGTTGHNLDYNQYYTTDANEIIITWDSGNLKYTLAEVQSNLGYDINSMFGDPKFIDMNGGNYSLLLGSSAIDGGFNLGNPYDQAIDGTLRPQGSAYDIGAYEIITGPDVFPPEVIGAALIDSVTLKILFSEPLESSTAQNPNNYSITNGTSVFSAILSGSEVILNTSSHLPGIYTVTVNNVTDLAGNIISPSANSAQYEFVQDPQTGFIQFEIFTVTASVIPEPEHSPDKTIDGKGFNDGDPDSRWAGEPMPEWLIFDLGAIKSVGMTKFSFYNWNNSRIYNYNIEVSTDMNQWQEIITNATSSTEEWSVEELEPVDARFIKVVFINSNQNEWAGLWEGQIWGFNPTNVNDETQPEGFKLEQNYPNPFNPSTTIRYSLAESQNVIFSIYNTLGQLVNTVVKGFQSKGVHEIIFKAEELASGIYIYRLQTESSSDVRKMILQR